MSNRLENFQDSVLKCQSNLNYAQNPLTILRQFIEFAFNVEELRTFCIDLSIDYESLPGEGKAAKVRELVLYLGRLAEVLTLLEQCRADGFANVGLRRDDAMVEAMYDAMPSFEVAEADKLRENLSSLAELAGGDAKMLARCWPTAGGG